VDVPEFTKDALLDLKQRGEATMKKWSQPPTEWLADSTWDVTYCVENFIRTAAISRKDRAGFKLGSFLEAAPDFIEIFGPVHGVNGFQYPTRGPTIVLQFNDFIKNPFFPRDAAGGESDDRRG
jgi:hypothetical protein